MRKLKMVAMSDIGETLSRDELKKVFGGSDIINNPPSGNKSCCIVVYDGHFICTNDPQTAQKYDAMSGNGTGSESTWSCNNNTAYTNCAPYIKECRLTGSI